MTTFLESPRFPDCVSFGMLGGPAFFTSRAILDSGVEYGNQNWEQALRRYTVSFDARKSKHINDLLGFFHTLAGSFGYFRFKDHLDFRDNDLGHYAATSATGVFASIDSTHFQMYKRYTVGSTTHNRKITKPVAGTTVVTGGSGASVATTTGIVTVSSGTPTAWTGQFDVPCRLDTDIMRAIIINRNLTHGLIEGWQSIDIVEVRLI